MDLDTLAEDEQFPLLWQMSLVEKLTLTAILRRLRPQLALEIGTYEGGSLQVLSTYSQAVISLDINPAVAEKLDGRFSNAEFRSGTSVHLLPDLVASFNRAGKTPQFVLVDGDHSTEGVRRDIESLLALQPVNDVVVILHDSFNPDCRAGMTSANWSSSPHVHAVEIDFVPGAFFQEPYGTVPAGSMWGGFGCALLKPERRQGVLEIKQSERKVFETVLRQLSIHETPRAAGRSQLRQRVKRLLG